MADTFDRGVVAGSGVVLAAFVSLMGLTKRQLTRVLNPYCFKLALWRISPVPRF
jgi:hypothetical protein